MKKINVLWALSLILLGVTNGFLLVLKIMDVTLEPAVIISLGVADLVLLPVLVYTTMKKVGTKKDESESKGEENVTEQL